MLAIPPSRAIIHRVVREQPQSVMMPKTTKNSGCTSMIAWVLRKTLIMWLEVRRIRGIATWLFTS